MGPICRNGYIGDLFNLYVVSYLSLRFFVEFTRDAATNPHVLLGLTLVQVLYAAAIPLFAYKLWASFRAARKERRLPVEQREAAAA